MKKKRNGNTKEKNLLIKTPKSNYCKINATITGVSIKGELFQS